MITFVTGGSGFLGGSLIPTLVENGYEVRALARSDESARKIEEMGADVILGDLVDRVALIKGMEGCEIVFHAAGRIETGFEKEKTIQANVIGTENVVETAIDAGIRRLVHISSEAVLLSAEYRSMMNMNETWPLPNRSIGIYAETKKKAEIKVLAANSERMNTVVVRPRLIWGRGDNAFLPRIVEAIRDGSYVWINGGHYLTSTCHVDNATEGILKAADAGRSGEVYFLSDGEPIEFREFVTQLLKTQGIEPPLRSIPHWLASLTATATDLVWNTFNVSSTPLITNMTVRLYGEPVTVNDDKARGELGYVGSKSRGQALAELAGSSSL